MITVIRFDLGDEQRRAINKQVGKRGLATRKDIEQFVRMVLRATLEDVVHEQFIESDKFDLQSAVTTSTFGSLKNVQHCTTLDHCYPLGPKIAGETKCFCGRKRWGVD